MIQTGGTIVEILSHRVAADGPQPALGIKRGGQYQWLTWDEVATDVRQAASSLVAIGVKPGDRVAQVAENRYEWVIADLAIQIAGGIHVPVHPTLAGPQIAWQLRNGR